MPVTVRNYTAYLYPEEISEAKETLVGAYLTGCNDLNTLAADTLYMMTDSMDTGKMRSIFLFLKNTDIYN